MVCKKSSSSLVLFKGQWNDHNTDCLQPKMIPKCNTSDGDFDCSPVFEGVPLPISIIQAILAFIILLVSVFFNILLAMAIILYRRFLDKSLIVSVSILISNTAVSVFLNGGVFLTTVSQTWLLGYWGCQIFGVMAIGGSFSRWILVGLLSVDRFCRVFYPFRYARQEKKVLIATGKDSLIGDYWHIWWLRISRVWLSLPWLFLWGILSSFEQGSKSYIVITLPLSLVLSCRAFLLCYVSEQRNFSKSNQ